MLLPRSSSKMLNRKPRSNTCRHMKAPALPQSPEELLEALFAIFPEYRAHYSPIHDEVPSYHSVLIAFSTLFDAASCSQKQLKTFGALINEAVTEDGELENALGTCLLEHLHQINAERALRPYLSKTARQKTHA
jgi:hypothetical protein